MNHIKTLTFLVIFLVVNCGEPVSSKTAVPESNNDSSSPSTEVEPQPIEVKVCSFNIKFVGLYKKKDHSALSEILKDYDIVVIQELVSPPTDGTYPDGSTYKADKESKAFVDAMVSNGYEYWLSSEDTGTNEDIHKNSSATEWFIVFYKTEKVVPDDNLISGFLADDRSNHMSYERVPHAFSFSTLDGKLDFTLISVHLQPGSSSVDKSRRKEELQAIATWVDQNDEKEKDYIILGDMNIYSKEELLEVTPPDYQSLNLDCLPTNIASTGRPYDHIMYSLSHTATDLKGDFEIIDLVEVMRPFWNSDDPYPEDDRNLFYQYYSDHRPVVFTLISGNDND